MQGGQNKINHDPRWIGTKFNYLTVHEIVHDNIRYHWIMKCHCGKLTRVIRPNAIKNGKIKSCGCMRGKKNASN